MLKDLKLAIEAAQGGKDGRALFASAIRGLVGA